VCGPEWKMFRSEVPHVEQPQFHGHDG
jgi:hypothetical protein